MKKVLSLLFALLLCVGAYADTYKTTITSKTWSATGEQTLDGVAWNLATDGGYYGYDATKGQQVGSGSKPSKTLTLKTSDISGTITNVKVNTSGASSVAANVSVSVGGTAYGDAQTISTTATEYTFTGNSSGEIVISWAQTSSKALYFKSIEVEYTTSGGSSDPVSVEGVVITDKEGNELNYGQFSPCIMTVGESTTIKAAVTPSNATNKKVTWDVMQAPTEDEDPDADVVTFENGVVKAVTPGMAAIVATTEDGEYQALFYVYVQAPKLGTIADFIAAEGKACYLVGQVSDIKNTTYGNYTLTDESGSIYVYGTLTPEGVKQQFESLGIAEGDYIKVLASEYELFNGTPEAKNVIFVEKVEAPAPATTFDMSFADGIAKIVPSNSEATYAVGAYNQTVLDMLEEVGIIAETAEDVYDLLAGNWYFNDYVFTDEAEFDLLDYMEFFDEEKLAGDYVIMVAECELDEDGVPTRTGKITTLKVNVPADEPTGDADGSSFEKAMTLVEGNNTAKAVAMGYYDGAAMFKYTASETTVLSVTGQNGAGISFFNADESSIYDYTSSYDANYVATYSIKVAEGQTIYVQVNQGYGDTSDEVSCQVEIATGVLEHGMTADDAIALQMDKEYWFEGGNAYFTYTATEDGVVVFSQPSYCYGAKYTVDGVANDLAWASETKQMNMPVVAGKTYTIWTSASDSGIFSVSAKFTQPKQGDIIENPFIMAVGDNVLPKAAQKYYYKYTNEEDAGFLNLTIPEGVVLSARSTSSSWDNLLSHAEGTARIAVDMDQEIIIIANRAEEAEADGVLFAEYKKPEAGDTEALAIAITSADAISTAAGAEKYYIIKNETGAPAFLFVNVITEGISSYGSTVTVKAKGTSYGQSVGTGDEFKEQCSADAEYIICIKNNTAAPVEFSAWMKALEAGDSYSMPIVAALGQNTVAADGQKFYSYTATQDCKLTIQTGNPGTTTLFFPAYEGDEWMGLDGVVGDLDKGVWTLAATAGKPIIFRMTSATAGEKFTITEGAYGEGETRATAIELADNVIELDDLAPYKTWYVYTVAEDGVAEIIPADFEAPTWEDNVYYAVNDQYEGYNNLRGYNASYAYEMQTKSIAVKAGDKIYIRLDVKNYNEGATITFNLKGTEKGDLQLAATDGEKFYATFSSDRNVIIADSEAKVYTINVTDGKISLDDFSASSYTNTNAEDVYSAYYIPAGTGVLVVSDKESIEYTYGPDTDGYVYAPITDNTNLLRASSVAMDGDYKFYKLAYDNYAAKTGLGFFWGAKDGAAFESKAGCAYLAVTIDVADVKGYLMDGDTADAIDSINAVANNTIFNLQGQRIQKLQKGINIVGGKKVMVK